MTTPADRAERGRAARKQASRSSHGLWIPAADRLDPLTVLARQTANRVPELLPLRYERMAASPFAFLRGAAAVMAADLATQPRTGLTVQLCGDAHLLNFGVFASPERALLFDLNDFDETLPGPFEWDVKRLAASIAVAAGENGHSEAHTRQAVQAASAAYRTSMRRLSARGELDVWYERLDAEDILPLMRSEHRKRVESQLARAGERIGLRTLDMLTDAPDGQRRITPDPPLLEPVSRLDMAVLRRIFIGYRSTLPEERRTLLDRFRFIDAARKVVGVSSVGTRCYIVLLEGRHAGDPLFLQIREAERSVLEPHLQQSAYPHQGHRVVAGQRLLQAASDIFLGWVTGPEGRHFYWRQLRDMKSSLVVEDMSPPLLHDYARLCGAALARAHARSGDRIAIAHYLGGSDAFDRAMADFALRYADRNAADHAALAAAVAAGRLPEDRPGPVGRR
ncbi:DUF2252 domain-containing protein [Streptomyces scopuliridis]|uniref:DUF2252 domain-containing protein n=1 Tax=Streptomyces scopuliridis TaxID=452529 RepID=A0ACD4ZDJ1_9ACTN|nr:DUF2252 domain-containing protein [Streptomyces scopuliridis]WSB32078.1 DUF2252 domain-containing protein [Streptomyces scopuliridis]WSB96340.1 DUF2252 domain-containing protein [Streptomyces scopuliridis]WSC09955.1 DUF2252 domain-containing protein [Streptomyces scopuliridis]